MLAPHLPLFDISPEECSVENLAREMRHLLDREGVERAMVAGHSLGGHIALRMALHYPENVEGLILIGSSGLLERGFERDIRRRPDRGWVRRKMEEIFWDASHVTEDFIDEVMAVVYDPTNTMNLLRLAQSAKRTNMRPFLPSIECPVLLAWGAEDNVTPPAVAFDFERHLPNAELHLIEQCGHVPTVERPVELNRILEGFLNRQLDSVPAGASTDNG